MYTPILIGAAVTTTTAPWAADLRWIRHIGDFRQWKNYDSYQKAFERLLRDLKADNNQFTITFAPRLSKEQVRGSLEALAEYYRACGGVGFRVELEIADVLIQEPVDVLV